MKTNCVLCWAGGLNKYDHDEISILKEFKLCKSHTQEVDKHIMDCGTCGSQDTKYVTGISKSGKNAGKKWAAFECQEPNCKNGNYPSRTFVPIKPSPGNPAGNKSSGNPGNSNFDVLNKKLDLILSKLGGGQDVAPEEETATEEPF